jgi:hypothetical protein
MAAEPLLCMSRASPMACWFLELQVGLPVLGAKHCGDHSSRSPSHSSRFPLLFFVFRSGRFPTILSPWTLAAPITMASDQNLLAGLELMQSGHSEQQTAILNAFDLGMAPSADAVADAVCELDRLCPPLERREEVIDYLWATWEMMFDIVQSNVQDEVHERLIRILGELQRLERGVLDVWGVSTIHDVHYPVVANRA